MAMSDKKITLDAKDRERLSQLMKQKEAELDAANLSDEELEAEEKALEVSLRRLAERMSPATQEEKEAETAAWKHLQEKIEGPELKEEPTDHKEGKVIPLFRGKSFSPMWVGALTVAALALLMVLPQRRGVEEDANDPLFVTKGSSDVPLVNCELDVIGQGGARFSPTPDGLGYLGKPGSVFEIAILCDQSGILHVDALGAETKVLHNIAISAGEKHIIKTENFKFNLDGSQGWNFNVLLTKDKLPADLLIPQTVVAGEALGDTRVLWADSLLVRGDAP
jgi:hypothetical protein